MEKKDIPTVVASRTSEVSCRAPHFKTPIGYDDNSYLDKLCREGLLKRYGIKDATRPEGVRERAVLDRLDCELKCIERKGLAGQFLIMWDMVMSNRKHNVFIGPGHGAEAGTLVCYLLGITGIDPFRYRLFMEKFINPDRVYQPSFTLESCEDGRYIIIDYVKDRYGHDNTASFFTVYDPDLITTIRNIGRAQRVPSKKINHLLQIIQEAIAPDSQYSSQQLKTLYRELRSDPVARNIMDKVYIIEELCRDAMFNASSIIISNEPLHKMIPVGTTNAGDLIALPESYTANKLGFMMMDIVGSKSLTTMRMILQILKNKGIQIDIELIPLDDPETFKLIHDGNALEYLPGEKSAMQDWVYKLSPVQFNHLIAFVALCRPGPIRFMNNYIARKTDKMKIHYDHPLLEPILHETYGTWIYHHSCPKQLFKNMM